MLTTKEIKNLRIGDDIYINGDRKVITALSEDHISTRDGSNLGASYYNTDKDLSLTPPKKKVKMYLYAFPLPYPHDDFIVTDKFYKEDDKVILDSWIKVKGSMIEVEE